LAAETGQGEKTPARGLRKMRPSEGRELLNTIAAAYNWMR
jgi:hypothetical protein